MLTRLNKHSKFLGFATPAKVQQRNLGDYGAIVTNALTLVAIAGGVGALTIYITSKYVYDNYKIVKKEKHNDEEQKNNSESQISMRPGNSNRD